MMSFLEMLSDIRADRERMCQVMARRRGLFGWLFVSFVLEDVPAGSVVVGIPARVVKSRAESIDFDAIASDGLQRTERHARE